MRYWTSETETESNRLFLVRIGSVRFNFFEKRFEFGSVRLVYLKFSSARFGSILFLKTQFGFGSVRVHS
jgi:hypothetical protein